MDHDDMMILVAASSAAADHHHQQQHHITFGIISVQNNKQKRAIQIKI